MTEQEEYEKYLHVEHELINRRLTWLLSSQSLLFAAIAFVLGQEILTSQQSAFSQIVPLLGMGISIAILIGVLMAILAKFLTWRDHRIKTKNKQLGVRTYITVIAFIPDILMPIAFTIAWYWIRMAIV